jgi:hypothetical protein
MPLPASRVGAGIRPIPVIDLPCMYATRRAAAYIQGKSITWRAGWSYGRIARNALVT